MSKKTLNKVHLIYGIVLSVLLCVIAVMCVVLCYNIYKTGPSPFTRQVVYENFKKISILVYFLIALTVGGVMLNVFLPQDKQKTKGRVKDTVVLYKLSKKLTGVDKETSDKIEKQRIIRFVMIIISFIVLFGATIGATVHSVSGFDSSSKDINEQMIKACLTILSYFSAPVLYLIVTVFLCKYSVKKELEIVKNHMKNQKIGDDVSETQNNCMGTFTKVTSELTEGVNSIASPKKWHKYISLTVTCVLLAVSVVFIISGVFNGGAKDVLTKAINICTECIGMG